MMSAVMPQLKHLVNPDPQAGLAAVLGEVQLPESELRFVTDQEGTIIDYDRQRIFDWLKTDVDLEGFNLRSLLVCCRPHWEFRLLRDSFAALPSSMLLPWLNEGDELPGLEWQVLSHNGVYFVTLSAQGIPAQSNRLAGVCWSNLLEHFAGGSYRQRPDLSFLFVSSSLRGHLGLDMHDPRSSGEPFINCIHPYDRRELNTKLKAVETERQDAVTWQYRFRNPITKKLHFLTDVRMPIYDNAGILVGFEGVLMDVTRQATVENKATGTDWQENLSLLITGLAHDFGNVISGLSVLAETHGEESTGQTFQKETVEHIRDYSRQANHLIRRILDVSSARQGTKHKALHNFESLMLEAADLVMLVVGRRSKVHIETDEVELPVYLDAPGFQQMVLNFAANARDARNGGVEVWMTARRCHRDELVNFDENTCDSAYEEWVEFTFGDNGSGVPEGNLERIFDPFFTTKATTSGSGLGLYNARVFCEEQGGSVFAQQRDPHGLKVVVRFPLLNEEQIIQHIEALHQQS